jgi:hypothetical protein
MPKKPITQKNFKRGLVANTPEQAQPPDSLVRVSNLVYTRRGGLRTCDGSQIITALNGSIQTGSGPFTELFLFQPQNVSRYYIGIKKDYATHLGVPVPVASDAGAGGTLLAGTYRYKVTTLDGAGGETTASAETSVTIVANHLIGVTWPAIPNAGNGGYKIYRTAVNGAINTETLLATVGTGNTTYQDNGSVSPDGVTTPPTTDTTQVTQFYKLPGTSYGAANILSTFPADPFVPNDGTPGGIGGGGGTTNPSSGGPPTPAGGNTGNTSPLPMIQQFANKAILALGNGFAPQLYADTTQPDWTLNTQKNAGDVIKPLLNNAGSFYYIAKTGGTTGGAEPSPFNQTIGGTTSDGTVTWQNIGNPPVVALFNTFTSIYPDWNANVTVNQGDLIRPTANNAGGFVFQAQQTGTTGAAAPTFPQTNGQIVAEANHNVSWKNIGIGNTSPAPRGAAHIEVYAGALWVTNTSPTTTTDQLDGPSALRMSDINNPLSWNPLNTAFIDRDDGDQTTGLKSMTIAESGIPPTGSLVVFKNFKTFQINGVFGSSSFSIQRAQTDLGCVASRTIEFCPGFGIIRLAHLGFALFDTTRDHVISEQIRPFLFDDPNIPDINAIDWNFAYLAKAAQTADPPMYVCAIPVALTNLPTGGSNASFTFTNNIGGSWVTGFTYYFRIYAQTATGFTQISQELALQVIGVFFPLGALGVFTPPVTPIPGVISYRVFLGFQSGIYTEFKDCSATAQTFFTDSTSGSWPGSGTPDIGIGGLTRLFCYDLVQKAWTIIDLPFSISVLRQVRPPGSEPITITGGRRDMGRCSGYVVGSTARTARTRRKRESVLSQARHQGHGSESECDRDSCLRRHIRRLPIT